MHCNALFSWDKAIIKKKMDTKINYKKTCRLCAENIFSKFTPLFENETILSMKFIHSEEYNIKITKNDGLPQNICSECLEQLSRLKIFLIKCTEAENFFLNKLKKIENSNALSECFEALSDFTYKENNCDIKKTELTELVLEEFKDEELTIKSEDDYEIFIEESISETSVDKPQKTKVENNNQQDQSALKSKDNTNCNLTKRKTRSNSKPTRENDVKSKILQLKKDDITTPDKDYSKLKKNKIILPLEKDDRPSKDHSKLKGNIKTKTEKIRQKFLCDLCGKEFVKRENLKDHMNTHSGIKPYKCEICDKAFFVRNALRKHADSHSDNRKTYTCEICNKVYTTKTFYQSHLLRHKRGYLLDNNEKPFKCPLCIKSFKLLSTLTAHCNTHSKPTDQKYHCEECNANFKRSDRLKEHMNSVHYKIFPFKCDLCPKAFVTGAIRNNHVKRYHSGKRHKCDLCDKDFSLSDSLTKHKRVHYGEKRFVCEICNMGFVAVYQIEKHMATHKIDETTKSFLISQAYEEITNIITETN